MKQFISLSLVVAVGMFVAVGGVVALDTSLPNNKFGIHLAQPEDEDFKGAGELVNSTGGKWGYITLVIQENDRNIDKWQDVMDKLRAAHLIPIIRIATHPEGASWRRPSKEDAQGWADFLGSLQWVVKDRYVILFNEPNHGAEWGGGADPVHYAEVAHAFSKALKAKNKDFFVMLAGLDASAPQAPPAFIDEAAFFSDMRYAKPELFGEDLIDGLASHSYPNPGFSGSPYSAGRGTIRNYEWELEYFRSLGINKELPVFITETGWSSSAFSYDTIGEFFRIAYQNVWLPDGRVRAVTPFILNYQGDPFLQFSWKKFTGERKEMPILGLQEDQRLYYDHYYTVAGLQKVKGEPEQIQKGTIDLNLPSTLVASSAYNFRIKLKNDGQAIWDKDDDYRLVLANGLTDHFFSDLTDIKPREEALVDLHIKTGNQVGRHKAVIALFQGPKKIVEASSWSFEVIPAPSLAFKVNLFPRVRSDVSRTYEIQIFDESTQLVYKKSGLKVSGGVGTIEEVPNVYFGGRFRVVVLTRHYLPRQAFVTFQRGTNIVAFEPLLPLDFDRNGSFEWGDIGTLFTNPKLFRLLLP